MMKKISIALLLTLTAGLIMTGCSGGATKEEEKNAAFDNTKPVPAEDGAPAAPAGDAAPK